MTFTIPSDIPDLLQREMIAAASRRWDTRGYSAKVGDAISQLGNAAIGGAPDESLSGRAYRITTLQPDRPPIFWQLIRWAADAIFLWQKGNHCQLAFWEDIYRCRARAVAAELIAEVVALKVWGNDGSLPASAITDSHPEATE